MNATVNANIGDAGMLAVTATRRDGVTRWFTGDAFMFDQHNGRMFMPGEAWRFARQLQTNFDRHEGCGAVTVEVVRVDGGVVMVLPTTRNVIGRAVTPTRFVRLIRRVPSKTGSGVNTETHGYSLGTPTRPYGTLNAVLLNDFRNAVSTNVRVEPWPPLLDESAVS